MNKDNEYKELLKAQYESDNEIFGCALLIAGGLFCLSVWGLIISAIVYIVRNW